METKICKYCNEEKNINDFRKNRNKCKKCENNYNKEWYLKNKDNKLKYSKEYRNENIDLTKKWALEWKNKNLNYQKEYYFNNKEKILIKSKENYKKRLENDSVFKFKIQIRKMIYNSFYRKKYNKKIKCEKILGCTYETFINHLLKTFVGNYNYKLDGIEKVHIDHIMPLSTAKTEQEILKLCHYTNLQLLKAEDNLHKSNKLNWELKT